MKRMMMIAATVAAGIGMAPLANAADLPKTTQKMLKALKLNASILKGVDQELTVPKAWLKTARNKEKIVKIYTTMRPKAWKKMNDIWKERYPGIELKHSEVRGAGRRYIRPLAAFKEGRYLTDIVMGLSGNVYLFRNANAFHSLADIPTYKSAVPDATKQKDHIAAATRSRYWCMSYNTKRVKKSDLPKTWDDLVNSKRFGGKKLLIGNRPNNWLLNLWEAKGDDWGRDFTTKMMKGLKPQLRKEGMSGLLQLVILGEGDAAIPSAMNRVAPLHDKGAPIGHHCPTPVVNTVSELGVFKNAPHINGAKIWVNWFLSKEGQIAQYWANKSTPVHKGLQGKEFIRWPASVKGKALAVHGTDSAATSVRLAKFWNPLWLGGGGYIPPKASIVTVKLEAVKRGGRRIHFTVNGKKDKAKVSRSRTKIEVGGKSAKRKDMKVGMTCKVKYPAGGGEAKYIKCN
ncbi:MAG: ABC transporter substrate-binding protein [Rhodospirillales bacterium]|jgi:iron(III) transport system substrate-binding protein|nr:ABC transporter substrate-binding protein [Rhodospirillales bacterium]MBT4006443.1 ABC transporter substrate-binding protein [Rhodospirillales bacterium]MBT5076481.1 ABC transporter substrate-binding protein [Rhodospirillales bacterium]MBT5112625.1 ABC transporter substrate-binding protein [Rhodospirillales bacterium]MBT5673394.1 ABC transporter substrate-binding protein [Rhodospirillales bacterium]